MPMLKLETKVLLPFRGIAKPGRIIEVDHISKVYYIHLDDNHLVLCRRNEFLLQEPKNGLEG